MAYLSLNLVASSFSVEIHASANPTTPAKTQSSTKNNETESAASGLKLIEEIMRRLDNMPKLAISKHNQLIAQVSTVKPAGGPTNMLLAIQPKQMTYASPARRATPDRQFYRAQRQLNAVDDRPGVLDYRTNLSDVGAQVASKSSPENAPIGLTDSSNSPANQSYPRSSGAAQSALARAASASAPVSAADDERTRSWDQLATSINKFGGAISQMQTVQQKSSSLQMQSQARPRTETAVRGSLASNKNLLASETGVREYNTEHSDAKLTNNAARSLFNAPRATPSDEEYNATSAGGFAGGIAGANPAPMQSPAPVMVPAHPENYKYLRQFSSDAVDKFAPISAEPDKDATGIYEAPKTEIKSKLAKKSIASSALKAPSAKFHNGVAERVPIDQLAIAPTNVITGVPLVHLGASSSKVSQVLASRGPIKTSSIGGWTVMTLLKSGVDQPAMHVYIRHGIIEAMRVFDQNLINEDFGLVLGADVSEVKSKFGEPAFMLGEPGINQAAGGQNYVYPLSQVSFQMARAKPHTKPQLVSILIFTVK